jgi:hypothetical protein
VNGVHDERDNHHDRQHQEDHTEYDGLTAGNRAPRYPIYFRLPLIVGCHVTPQVTRPTRDNAGRSVRFHSALSQLRRSGRAELHHRDRRYPLARAQPHDNTSDRYRHNDQRDAVKVFSATMWLVRAILVAAHRSPR